MCAAGWIGKQAANVVRNKADFRCVLPQWEMCSPRMDVPDLLANGSQGGMSGELGQDRFDGGGAGLHGILGPFRPSTRSRPEMTAGSSPHFPMASPVASDTRSWS